MAGSSVQVAIGPHTRAAVRAWVLCAAWSTAVSGCTRDRESTLAQSPPLTIDVEYAGCAEVRRGPVCDIAPGSTLVVWAHADESAALDLAVDGGATDTSSRAVVQDGVRWKVTIPDDTRAVMVRGGDTASGPRVVIPIVHEAPLAGLVEAEKLRNAGRFVESEAALDAIGTDIGGANQARVAAKRARLAMATGRTDDAVGLFREAIALDEKYGLLSAEIDDRVALGYLLIFDADRYAEADDILRPLEALAREVPQARTTVAYILGLFADITSDLRTAAVRGADARVRATRLDMNRELRAALVLELDVVVRLGLGARATELVERLAAGSESLTNPCERAQTLYNVAYYRTELLHARGLQPTAEDVADLRTASALTREACANPRKHAQYVAKLALALARTGDLNGGRSTLDELNGAKDSLVVFADAEIALEMGDFSRALSAFAVARSMSQDSAHSVWASWLGTAKAYLRAGDELRAIAALRAAEDALEGYAFLVPYGGGHATFLDAYSESARLLVDTLLSAHRVEDAFAAARRARRRGLASLAWRARVESLTREGRGRWYTALSEHRRQRSRIDAEAIDDWKLSADRLARVVAARRARISRINSELEAAFAAVAPLDGAREDSLPTIAPKELVILVHQGATGSVVFASLDGTVTATSVGPIDPHASMQVLGRVILGPLTQMIADADRIKVWNSGATDQIDIHALPFDGQPLAARLPVAYGLDITRPAAGPPDPAVDAVVIVDPRGDLSQARDEATAVEAAVVRGGGRAKVLVGDDGTRDALIGELGVRSVGLLHVASHAVYGGLDGWDSYIRLAHQDELAIADILTLEHVPARVVLSGCETARDDLGHATSLNLAHALILAGAGAVVAATRVVDDGEARQTMSALYDSPDFRDLPVALGAAQAVMAARSSRLDWASFRVIVP